MSTDRRVPKICGADVELGNALLGAGLTGSTCFEASRELLRELDGVPLDPRLRAVDAHGQPAVDPQDYGRKFRLNGGCVYIDLNHLELCLPEVRSARDWVAAWHAALRDTREAQRRANARLDGDARVVVLVNNSDGHSHSYGAHIDLLVSRRCFTNLFERKPHHLAFLAAYQASSVVFTGQGKVGGENGRGWADYQLSQRADFIETLAGVQTTYNRPLVNSRDEALCGRPAVEASGLARLHVIYADATLCHVASFLRVGVLQIVLALLEAESIDLALALEDPVAALHAFSRDPALQVAVETVGLGRMTALELQGEFLLRARKFVDAGGCDDVVPEAEAILDTWESTLELLVAGDLPALARRLDWALKRLLLERALTDRPVLDWRSPEIKHLDQIYGSLDPAEGLWQAVDASGGLERVVDEARIERFRREPPDDTRAWTRARLLALAPGAVDDVDWDRVRLRLRTAGGEVRHCTIDLPDPAGFTRADTAAHFGEDRRPGATLAGLERIRPAGRHEERASDIRRRSPRRPAAWPPGPVRGGNGDDAA